MKRILTLIALLYTFSVSAQFNYPTAAPAWFYRARSAAPTMDTTDYSAVIYPGLLQFRQQPGDTGYYLSNGLRYVRIGADDTFVTGTVGTDFSISSAGSVHTFNIPDASAAARGLVTTGVQTFAGNKTFGGNITTTGVGTFGVATANTVTATGIINSPRLNSGQDDKALYLDGGNNSGAIGSSIVLRGGTYASTPGEMTFHTGVGTGSLRPERMRINANGNVGIGTYAPEQRLHVIGSFIAGDTAATDNGRLLMQPTFNGVNITGQAYNGTSWLPGNLYFLGSSIEFLGPVDVQGDFSTENVNADNVAVGIANTSTTGFVASNFTTYPLDNAGGEINISLPDASLSPGRLYLFSVGSGEGAGGFPVTIGGQSVVLGSGTKGPLAIVQSNGTTWIYLQGF